MSANEIVVFEAVKQPPPTYDDEFAPLEASYGDDELVYSVAHASQGVDSYHADANIPGTVPITAETAASQAGSLQSEAPCLPFQASSLSQRASGSYSRPVHRLLPPGQDIRLCSIPAGKKSLVFEGHATGSYCQFLADTGASHSFLSKAFCIENNIPYRPQAASARMANGNATPIIGQCVNVWIKLRSFRAKFNFLVVDMPQFNAVLGMDFFDKHHAVLHAKKRMMTLSYKHTSVCLDAFSESELPEFHSDFIELCTLQSFSQTVRNMPSEELDEAFVAYVKPEFDSETSQSSEPLLQGKGALEPDIARILREFNDVLITEMPGGLPPHRQAADGSPIEHTIETAADEKPYARPPRPFTAEEDATVKKYISDFLERGWIKPSLSPWAAPVLFVPKKPDPVTGKKARRMVISFVKLNSKTLNRIAYRLPRISDLLARISGARFFTKLDLLDGYYQIRMKAADIPKTAFTTPYGNFDFRVMPMGLCGAPSTFQYMMDETFRADVTLSSGDVLPFLSFIAVYLDDVCIFSKTREEHLMHVTAVLQRLRDCNLYVKPTKCEWMQTTIEFLGHMVSEHGLSVHPAKCAALQQWPAPVNVSELRTLLGTFGFWRSYIRGYADIAAPLTALTSKSSPWRWGTAEQAALDKLKVALVAAPVLMHPDTDKPFFVVTDASNFAAGASLEQETADGSRRPVAFFSHRLIPAERNYPTHERELLAIVLALRVWRHFLYGSAFKVVCQTDHRPLQHFMEQVSLSSRQVMATVPV